MKKSWCFCLLAFAAVGSFADDQDELMTARQMTAIPAHQNFVVDLGNKSLATAGSPLPPAVLEYLSEIQAKSGAAADRINWDGKGVIDFLAGKDEKVLPRDFFLKGQRNNSTSKHIFTNGVGQHAHVSNSSDAFSPHIDFGPTGGSKLTITFTTNDQGHLGAVHAFGAIFLGVKRAHVEGIRYYDRNGNLLVKLRAKAHSKFQLVGTVFDDPVIWKAIIDFDPKHTASDVDDFFFDKTAV